MTDSEALDDRNPHGDRVVSANALAQKRKFQATVFPIQENPIMIEDFDLNGKDFYDVTKEERHEYRSGRAAAVADAYGASRGRVGLIIEV